MVSDEVTTARPMIGEDVSDVAFVRAFAAVLSARRRIRIDRTFVGARPPILGIFIALFARGIVMIVPIVEAIRVA
jgi:hypothetical protein